jgi:hypothetical protein
VTLQNPTTTLILRATGAVARRQRVSRASYWILFIATVLALFILAFLAYDIVREGSGSLSLLGLPD